MSQLLLALQYVVEITKDSKKRLAGLFVLLAAAGIWLANDVNAKHEEALQKYREAMQKVGEQDKSIVQLNIQSALVAQAVQEIQKSTSEIRTTVLETDRRVWQIQRDVYTIKTTQANSGLVSELEKEN